MGKRFFLLYWNFLLNTGTGRPEVYTLTPSRTTSDIIPPIYNSAHSTLKLKKKLTGSNSSLVIAERRATSFVGGNGKPLPEVRLANRVAILVITQLRKVASGSNHL